VLFSRAVLLPSLDYDFTSRTTCVISISARISFVAFVPFTMDSYPILQVTHDVTTHKLYKAIDSNRGNGL